MPLLLWLLGAHAQITPKPASFYFKLGNTLDAYLAYEHEITYENTGPTGKKCPAVYEPRDGPKLDIAITVPFHDDRAVRENQCYLKCMGNPTAPECGGYVGYCEGATMTKKPECFSGSNVICVPATIDNQGRSPEVAALCNSVTDCDSFFIKQYKDKTNAFYGAELYKAACRDVPNNGMAAGAGGKVRFRDLVNTPEACPLGFGVEIHAATAPYQSMIGLYEGDMTTAALVSGEPRAPKYYVHVSDSNPNYIAWHTSGCGWVGLMYNDTTAPEVVTKDCFDDDKVANFVFGQCTDMKTCVTSDPDYEPDLCSKIVTVWGGEYCLNNMFAMICPATCSANCLADNEEAAEQYRAMLTGEFKALGGTDKNLGYCGVLERDMGCGDVVIKKVCSETCAPGSRRLSEEETVDLAALHKLRRMLRDQRKGRRLGWEGPGLGGKDGSPAVPDTPFTGDGSGKFEEVFYTFNGADPASCTPTPLDYKLETTEVFDVRTFHTPLPDLSWAHKCDVKTTFVVTDSSENKYCQYNNIPAPYNALPKVVENTCFRKCSKLTNVTQEFEVRTFNRDENGTRLPAINDTVVFETRFIDLRFENREYLGTDTITVPRGGVYDPVGAMAGPSGEFIWCSGYSEEFTGDTNALCLPREECEELCAATEGCDSIDMHEYLPRCYLNTKECDAEQDNLGAVWKSDDDFNILLKKGTPTETEDPLADDERIVFVTDTKLDCSNKMKVPSYKDIARTGRVACEKECDDEGSACTFFYVDYTEPESPECRIFKTLDKAKCTPSDGEGMLVEKVLPKKCKVTVTADDEDVVYTRCETLPRASLSLALRPHPCLNPDDKDCCKDEAVYLDPYNATRISYVSDKAKSKPECDGWKMQKNLAAVEKRTVHNCTDRMEAAKIWVPDFVMKTQVDKWNKDYEENYPLMPCKDRVNEEAEELLGITYSEFLQKTEGQGCLWLIRNFTNSGIGITEGMSIWDGMDYGIYYVHPQNRDVPGSHGDPDAWRWEDATNGTIKHGRQWVFDTRLIKNGTALCDLCCGSFYEHSFDQNPNNPLECPAKYRRQNESGFPNSSLPTYYEYYRYQKNIGEAQLMERMNTFPCQWGADEGFCTNPVFHGICPHTCTPLAIATVGDMHYSGQDLVLYGEIDEFNSTCTGDYDNNWAAYNWRVSNVTRDTDDAYLDLTKQPTPDDAKKACDFILNQDIEICFPGHFSYQIMMALCPNQCKTATVAPTPAPPPFTDETDLAGAPIRRMQHEDLMYTTTMGGLTGVFANMITEYEYEFQPYKDDDELWEDVYVTWMNGSSLESSPASGAYWLSDGSLVKGTDVCEDLDGSDGKKYGALEASELFDVHMKKMAMTIAPVCRGTKMVCPALTVCVLNEQRMQDELSLLRPGVARGAFLSELDGVVRDPVLNSETFQPKVLISADRAEALIDATKWEFAHSIYRSVPLATRVVPQAGSVFGDKSIVSLVPAALAEQELGRSYGERPPAFSTPNGDFEGMETWRSDVIRIERFNGDGTAMTEGTFKFKLLAPDMATDNIVIYMYDSVNAFAPATLDITSIGGTVEKLTEEKAWMVTVPRVNADFIAAEDFDECAVTTYAKNGEAKPCQVGIPSLRDETVYSVDAICTNRFNALPECSCPAGYGDPESNPGYPGKNEGLDPITGAKISGSACTLTPITYTSADYYLAIRHTDRLDYGWRLNEIYLYKDSECKTKIGKTDMQPFPAPQAVCIGADGEPPCSYATCSAAKTKKDCECGEDAAATCNYKDDTYRYITQNTNVYTGEFGKSNYPSANDRLGSYVYTNGNIFDQRATSQWWSSCLNCNPEEVDTTHGGAVEILVVIGGSASVQCLEIDQVEGHMTDGLVIERGPVSGPGCGLQYSSSTPLPRCPPTMTWTKTGLTTKIAAGKGFEFDAKVSLSCGLGSTLFWGEMLHIEGTAETGHLGSMPSRAKSNKLQVPSACHCQELCIQYIDKGCRSYKYDSGTPNLGHCYLQTNLFQEDKCKGEAKDCPWVPPAMSKNFPQYTSGTPHLRLGTVEFAEGVTGGTIEYSDAAYLTGFSFSPGPPVDGQPFDLTITGVGLPFSNDEAKDTSDFQRVKIVEASEGCHVPVPKEVMGIGCAKSTRVIPTAGGSREQVVHTICSPRPDVTSAESVTWSGLTLTAGAKKKTYSVCYCPGDCFLPSSWEKLLGTFEMTPATFSWTTAEKKVYRKAGGPTGSLELTVKRPPFGSYSNVEDWELKVVKKHFDCSVVQDSDKFACATATLGVGRGADDDEKPEVVEASVNKTFPVDALYLVEFDEEVKVDNCGAAKWIFTDSSGTPVNIACGTVGPTDDIRATFKTENGWGLLLDPGTRAEGLASLEWEDGVVEDMNGNAIAAGKVGLTIAALTTGFTNTYPAVGADLLTDGKVQVYFGRAVVAADYEAVPDGGLGAVEIVDCGVDGACGTEDDFAEDITATWLNTETIEIAAGISYLEGRTYQVTVPSNSSDSTATTASFPFSFGCPNAGATPDPDTAVWKYTLNIGVEDVGKYQVCFRESRGMAYKTIPSDLGAKYVDVLPIEADSTHPSGVFHNQFFSSLAGASFLGSFTVAGTRLSVPSDSKVVLSAGSCGDPGTFGFNGTATGTASTDVTAPTMDVTKNVPADGATVGKTRAVTLAFNEPLDPTYNEDCAGKITIIDGNSDKYEFTCDYFLIAGPLVTVSGIFDAATTYTVEVAYDALRDLAGNPVTKIDTQASGNYEFTVGTGTGDVPAVLYSVPSDDMQFVGNETGNDAMSLYWSVDVGSTAGTSAGVAGKFINLYDCGDDFECDDSSPSTDKLFYRWAADQVTTEAGVTTFDTADVVGSKYRRYKLVVEAGAFKGGAGAGTGEVVETTVEFVNDRTGFSSAFVLSPSPSLSTASGLVYPVTLGANSTATTYSLCYCDDQADVTLEALGDGETTYKLTDDKKQVAAQLIPADDTDIATTVLLTNAQGTDELLKDHECDAKCSMGCTGPNCYCDGYEAGVATAKKVYCLPPSLCRDACDAVSKCDGINVHDVLPQCLLSLQGVAAGDDREDWQYFTKTAGTACTQAHDFTQTAGKFAVTTRVDVEVDYVVTPGEEVSIELTSESGLTLDRADLLSEDRITIIDSLGTCGLSSPSASVTTPAKATDIATWAALSPWSYFQDAPHEDDQNPVDYEKVVPTFTAASATVYNRHKGTYCPGSHVDVHADDNMDLDALQVPLGGVMVAVKEHQCYTKCALNTPCTGDYCFCEGYFSGYDDLSSNAICGDETFCKYLCDNVEDCKSIDMHQNGARCFLNTEDDCAADPTPGAEDPPYDLLIKSKDGNDEQRRLKSAAQAPVRKLQVNERKDYSFAKLLRFKPIEIATGGTFKVCFCDSTLLAEGAVCSSVKDFSVTVGTVHASGVSCLISNKKLQRVSCASQLYGGLRCYSMMEAPTPSLPPVEYELVVEEERDDSKADKGKSTGGAMAAEER